MANRYCAIDFCSSVSAEMKTELIKQNMIDAALLLWSSVCPKQQVPSEARPPLAALPTKVRINSRGICPVHLRESQRNPLSNRLNCIRPNAPSLLGMEKEEEKDVTRLPLPRREKKELNSSGIARSPRHTDVRACIARCLLHLRSRSVSYQYCLKASLPFPPPNSHPKEL